MQAFKCKHTEESQSANCIWCGAKSDLDGAIKTFCLDFGVEPDEIECFVASSLSAKYFPLVSASYVKEYPASLTNQRNFAIEHGRTAYENLATAMKAAALTDEMVTLLEKWQGGIVLCRAMDGFTGNATRLLDFIEAVDHEFWLVNVFDESAFRRTRLAPPKLIPSVSDLKVKYLFSHSSVVRDCIIAKGKPELLLDSTDKTQADDVFKILMHMDNKQQTKVKQGTYPRTKA